MLHIQQLGRGVLGAVLFIYYQPKTVRNNINCGFSPSYYNVLALQSTNIQRIPQGGMLRFRGFIVLVNIHKIDRRDITKIIKKKTTWTFDDKNYSKL